MDITGLTNTLKYYYPKSCTHNPFIFTVYRFLFCVEFSWSIYYEWKISVKAWLTRIWSQILIYSFPPNLIKWGVVNVRLVAILVLFQESAWLYILSWVCGREDPSLSSQASIIQHACLSDYSHGQYGRRECVTVAFWTAQSPLNCGWWSIPRSNYSAGKDSLPIPISYRTLRPGEFISKLPVNNMPARYLPI